jgi:hypothetical protein
MYYLRTRPAVDAIKFTVDQVSLAKKQSNQPATQAILNNEDDDKEQAKLICSVRIVLYALLIGRFFANNHACHLFHH